MSMIKESGVRNAENIDGMSLMGGMAQAVLSTAQADKGGYNDNPRTNEQTR